MAIDFKVKLFGYLPDALRFDVCVEGRTYICFLSDAGELSISHASATETLQANPVLAADYGRALRTLCAIWGSMPVQETVRRLP